MAKSVATHLGGGSFVVVKTFSTNTQRVMADAILLNLLILQTK